MKFILLLVSLLLNVPNASSSRIGHATERFGQSHWKAIRSLQSSYRRSTIIRHKSEPELTQIRGGHIADESLIQTSAKIVPAALLPSLGMWLVLAWNIQRRAVRLNAEKKTLVKTVRELQVHRAEKWRSLKENIIPLCLVLVAVCLNSRSLPWQPAAWEQGPSALALGLNFAYWVAEITMDTALDECGVLRLHIATAMSIMMQLVLISVLITQKRGHVIFVFKAAETLLATALAGVIDHLYWLGIALVIVAFMGSLTWTGSLATTPVDVSRTGALAYFAATLIASTAYQVVQKLTGTGIGNVSLVRTALCWAAVTFFGTPPSWILYDAINFVVFFGSKVLTDTVAIQAIARSTDRE